MTPLPQHTIEFVAMGREFKPTRQISPLRRGSDPQLRHPTRLRLDDYRSAGERERGSVDGPPRIVSGESAMELVEELLKVGFTPSAARTIAESGVVQTVEDLRAKSWGDTAEADGLMRQLLMARNGSGRVVKQVEAFRVFGDPQARPAEPITVKVELDADLAATLDDWIAAQPKAVGRSEAIRAMVAASLALMQPAPDGG
jgi:hypothetical protein